MFNIVGTFEPVGIISSPIVKCFPIALSSRAIQMFQTALHGINLEYMLTLKHFVMAPKVLNATVLYYTIKQ